MSQWQDEEERKKFMRGQAPSLERWCAFWATGGVVAPVVVCTDLKEQYASAIERRPFTAVFGETVLYRRQYNGRPLAFLCDFNDHRLRLAPVPSDEDLTKRIVSS